MAYYVSPFKNYEAVVQHREPVRWNATGQIALEHTKRLAANFGRLGDEQAVYNPLTGETVLVAEIRTGVFDTVEAQRQNGWTDEERELVELRLDWICENIPGDIKKLVPHRVAASAPWQSYDETAGERVVAIASELGIVPEALRYERENLNRDGIIADLEAALTPGDEGRAEPLEEITMDVPVSTPEAPAARIGKRPRTTASGIMADTPGLELKPEAAAPLPGGQARV